MTVRVNWISKRMTFTNPKAAAIVPKKEMVKNGETKMERLRYRIKLTSNLNDQLQLNDDNNNEDNEDGDAIKM